MPEVAARVPPVASSREKSALQNEFCKRLPSLTKSNIQPILIGGDLLINNSPYPALANRRSSQEYFWSIAEKKPGPLVLGMKS